MNTIIEKIRAEVERRRKQMDDASFPPVIKKTRISELSIVLDILDDIQERTDNAITFTLQEQPVCEDLEDEYKNYVESDPVYSKLVNGIVGLSIARHFAQWQMKKDLSSINKSYESGVVFGMNAQKEQMMKEAVEGKIGELGFHNAVYMQESKWTNFLDGFKKGDKVRIIIVKED